MYADRSVRSMLGGWLTRGRQVRSRPHRHTEIVDGDERSRAREIAIESAGVGRCARARLSLVTRAIDLLIAVAIAVVVVPGVARADIVDDESQELLNARAYKRRLAAALTLSKVHDGRAVRALVAAMERDDDPKLRQVAALALAKAVTEETPAADRAAAFAALQRVTMLDTDARVRELAARTIIKLDALRVAARPPSAGSAGNSTTPAKVTPAVATTQATTTSSAAPPAVFVYVASATDGTSKAPADATGRLTTLVRGVVVRRAPELPTQWPGTLPTAKDLDARGTKAWSVSANIASVEIVQRGSMADITCKVQVRVTPWNGTDGAERWVAHKAASASGQGRASTSTSARAIAGGIRDCVMAVAEEVTGNQVVPFLRKMIAST